ncbi:hypothetical protein Pla8534_70710 [Lignipirellula cremea]|uniref:Uncharacterized protein n=1 Tax=Lignipirellula cremea TaxID=2528010 RepID=A0A518E500_9BACT|nr:hypothetical protein Pla8534_70710 [Lignipirellula cremea]
MSFTPFAIAAGLSSLPIIGVVVVIIEEQRA